MFDNIWSRFVVMAPGTVEIKREVDCLAQTEGD